MKIIAISPLYLVSNMHSDDSNILIDMYSFFINCSLKDLSHLTVLCLFLTQMACSFCCVMTMKEFMLILMER